MSKNATATAIMGPSRRHYNADGSYVYGCSWTCPKCGHSDYLYFAYVTAIVCRGCKIELKKPKRDKEASHG
jgi:hypothetical protein